MTMEKVRHRWKWCEHNVTVSAYVPKEVYDRLVVLADEETRIRGKFISLSELVREILEQVVAEK